MTIIKPKPNGPKRQLSEKQKASLFQKGNKLGGRPLGSRNKLGEAFIQDFYEVWKTHGKDAIKRCAKDDPSTLVRVAAGILPKEIKIDEGESNLERILEKFGFEELTDLIAGLTALGASTQESSKAETKTKTGSRPGSVH